MPKNSTHPNHALLAAAISAARSQDAGKITSIVPERPDEDFAFSVKVKLPGRQTPGLSGFVACRALDRLKTINGDGAAESGSTYQNDCFVYVDREGLVLRAMNQYSFAPACCEIIACAIGDRRARTVIEAIIEAADDWSNGQCELFNEDGHVIDERRGVSIRVEAPRRAASKLLPWLERAGALITLLYAGRHILEWIRRG